MRWLMGLILVSLPLRAAYGQEIDPADFPPPVNLTALAAGYCTCNVDADCQGRKCINGFCYLSDTDHGDPICFRDGDCPALFQCCNEPDQGIIELSWQEPAPPTAAKTFAALASACGTVDFAWTSGWMYPQGWSIYVNGTLLEKHAADADRVTLSGLEAVDQTFEIAPYSLSRDLEGPHSTLSLTACDICPAAGDCALPHDCALDLFDILQAIDVLLGNATTHAGCDANCDGTMDLFDILRVIDTVTGTQAPPACAGAPFGV